MPLTCEPYKNKLAVRGDLKYDSEIRKLGGRWNSKMKNGAGWTVPLDQREKIMKLVENA